MKKILYIIGICLLTAGNAAFADDLQASLKTQANEPNIFTIIFALGFVVFLIYITGIIYSKLNVVGAKTAKNQFKGYDLNRAVIISTTQLGQNRNLHVVEINGKCYLVGATPNSINLIKDLGFSADYKEKTIEPPKEEEIDDAIQVLYGKEVLDEETSKISLHEEFDDFDVHKKYL